MSKEFSVEQLQTLMKCVSENHLGEFLYESEGVRLRIRGERPETPAPVLPPRAAESPAAPELPSSGAAIPAVESVPASAVFITSPLVGTFYSASSPDKGPFVKVGQHVEEGETVFIIESMKVMNEVPADKSGTVAEILVSNGDSVEYAQPILRLE